MGTHRPLIVWCRFHFGCRSNSLGNSNLSCLWMLKCSSYQVVFLMTMSLLLEVDNHYFPKRCKIYGEFYMYVHCSVSFSITGNGAAVGSMVALGASAERWLAWKHLHILQSTSWWSHLYVNLLRCKSTLTLAQEYRICLTSSNRAYLFHPQSTAKVLFPFYFTKHFSKFFNWIRCAEVLMASKMMSFTSGQPSFFLQP